MQEVPLTESQRAVHMGIIYTADPVRTLNTTRISSNLKSARGALYALFGAGMHGRRGLTPAVTRQLWIIFIVPILTYGTETWQLGNREYEPFELFQRKTLRCLQNLPDNTANVATLGLMGLLPVQYIVEARALNLLVSIITDRESLEFKIATRQIGTKDYSSNSWFIYVQVLLRKYDLDTVHQLLQTTPSRTAWKDRVKQATRQHWSSFCQEEVKIKSSLNYISKRTLEVGKVAPLWESARYSPSDSHKASVKAKFLTGTYRTQVNRAKFNQATLDPTCKLCHGGREDREHIILTCTALRHLREPFLQELFSFIKGLNIDCSPWVHNNAPLMQCVMDASHETLPSTLHSNANAVMGVEELSRNFIFVIHAERSRLLQAASPGT